VNSKACSKCGEEKPLTSFRVAKIHSTGRASQCKECAKKYDAISRARNRDGDRKRLKTWRSGNKHKTAAHRKVYSSVKMGQVEKPEACEECGRKTELNAHHEDYSQKLSVKWLCALCHSKEHTGRGVHVHEDCITCKYLSRKLFDRIAVLEKKREMARLAVAGLWEAWQDEHSESWGDGYTSGQDDCAVSQYTDLVEAKKRIAALEKVVEFAEHGHDCSGQTSCGCSGCDCGYDEARRGIE